MRLVRYSIQFGMRNVFESMHDVLYQVLDHEALEYCSVLYTSLECVVRWGKEVVHPRDCEVESQEEEATWLREVVGECLRINVLCGSSGLNGDGWTEQLVLLVDLKVEEYKDVSYCHSGDAQCKSERMAQSFSVPFAVGFVLESD